MYGGLSRNVANAPTPHDIVPRGLCREARQKLEPLPNDNSIHFKLKA
jgi:hypothetical protein